jgi:4-hydroxy-tetrahydrodipicolinate synthase
MTKQTFIGTGVAIVTPFQQNGDIDFPALKKLVQYLTDGQVEYLVVLGTTGETATLNKEEKQKIFSYVVEVNAGKLPLVAGLGGNDTKETIHSFSHFNLDGYDAILSVSPYYNKPSQEGLYQHYKALSEASPLSIIMYNVPGRTGMNVSAETTVRIAEDCRNIIATKEASGNFDQVMQIMKYKPKDFGMISGDDGITLPMIALGAQGVISVVANAYPEIFSKMVRHCLSGDFSSARPLHYMLVDIINTLFAEGSPSGVKAYMNEMGICGNHVRLPVVPVSDKLLDKIKALKAAIA